MTQREKNLLICVVTLVVGYGGWFAWGEWQDAVAARQGELQSAEIALAEARLREATAQASLSRLEGYRERSLPSDPEDAQPQYRDWLVEQFGEAGLELENIRRVTAPTKRGGAYTLMSFKVVGGGDIGAVTRFLHTFYSNAATHKITQLRLTPTEPKGQIHIDLDVEAIIVDGASRKSGLPSEPSGRLRIASLDDYLASVEGRNLFAEYTPPPPPKPPKPKTIARAAPAPKPPFDDSTRARFTGTVGSGDRLQAWINVLTTGDRLLLYAGDAMKVGQLEGHIVEVGVRHLIYEADDQRIRVQLGEFLRDGEAVTDSGVL